MKNHPTEEQKAAAAWLLLAYSLNHDVDCSCDRCRQAKKTLEAAKKSKVSAA